MRLRTDATNGKFAPHFWGGATGRTAHGKGLGFYQFTR